MILCIFLRVTNQYENSKSKQPNRDVAETQFVFQPSYIPADDLFI